MTGALSGGRDAVGYITTLEDVVNSGQTQSITYDTLDRLLSAQASGGRREITPQKATLTSRPAAT